MGTNKTIDGKRFRKIRTFKTSKGAKDYASTFPHSYYRVIKEWNSNLRRTDYILYVR